MNLEKMLENIEKFKQFGALTKDRSEEDLVYTPLEFLEYGFAIFSQEKYEPKLEKLKECQFKHRYYYYEDFNNKNNKADYKKIIFIMFNPSSACPHKDDPTIKNCRILAKNNQYSNMEIINIFSERNPKVEKFDTANNKGNKQFLKSLLNNRTDSDIVLACGYGKEKDPYCKNLIEEIETVLKNKQTFIIGVNQEVANKFNHHPSSKVWNGLGGFDNLATLVKR